MQRPDLRVDVADLPGATYQKRYACRVTGARDLVACCCAGAEDCVPETSSHDSDGCCPSEQEVAVGDCGCCDVTLERLGGELAAATQPSGADGPVLPPARHSTWEASPPPAAPLAGNERDKVPRSSTGPPAYLRYRSLLI